MEHHSLLELPGQLILTNSDLKVSMKGQQYITIYFEQPNKDGSDFNSMQIDYPDMTPQKVIGFTDTEIPSLLSEAEKIGDIALLRAQEDAYANRVS